MTELGKENYAFNDPIVDRFIHLKTDAYYG